MREGPNPIYLSSAELPYAGAEPRVSAKFKTCPEDFRVDECLGFDLEGAGQHQWLRIEKRDLTTEDVARSLARAAGVKPHEVGYAGLKDRRGVSTQWFSIDLGGRAEPDWETLLPGNCRIRETWRHTRKLRRGALRANTFDITLRELSGELEEIDTRVAWIARHGVPNYFGEQRFGAEARNVGAAYRLLCERQVVRNRYLRGLYFSCARSLLFNRVLGARVTRRSWDCAISGDVMMLDGTRSRFQVAVPDDTLLERVRGLDVHPTGPLWGKGRTMTDGEAGELETQVLGPYIDWCEGLEKAGLEHDRRTLRVAVRDLRYQCLPGHNLRVRFSLPPGAYATIVLRELVRSSTGRTPPRCRHRSGGPS